MTPSRIKKGSGYIKFSKLQEKAYLCDVDMDLLFDTFKQFYREGESSSALFGILCDNLPDLRGISTADEEELLKELEKELKRQKKHDAEHYKIYVDKKDGAQKYAGINYKLFADDLIGIYHFKTLRDTEQVLCYKNGYYQYNGEALIKEKAEEIFGELITTRGVNEIIGHVQRSTYIDRDKADAEPTILNLKNGLYNIKTNEFLPHTPEHIITARIPIKYDPTADCPEIKKFLKDIAENGKDVILLEEVPGFCLYRRYFIKKAIMLTGEGDNGKTIYINLIEHFLGQENYSSIVLQRLTLKDRFTNAFLVGMLANIAGDLSANALSDTGMFKMLTGGDYVPAEIKGGKIFKFLNSAKMIFSANEIPMTDDLTTAFWTRWIIINFPYKFVNNPQLPHEKKKIPEELLLQKLTTPEEMSGLLNVALDSLKRLLERREFSYDKSTEEIEEEYRRLASNIYGFAKEWCIEGVDEEIPKSELYNAYKLYCDWKKKLPDSKNMFGRELPRIATINGTRPKIEGKQVEAWRGIGLNDKFYSFIANSGNSSDFSYSETKQKNINSIWGENKENTLYYNYCHYEIGEITPELLNEDFEKLGESVCEGCEKQKTDLWSVKIGDTKGGYCISCIRNAIEQAREKKEGEAEEAEKQEKVGKKQKPKPKAPSEEKIKSDIESAKRSLEESGLRESRDKEDSDYALGDDDCRVVEIDNNEKAISEAITEILQDDPDFLTRDDEDHFFTVRSKLGEKDVEVDNATIVKVLEREKGANGGVVG